MSASEKLELIRLVEGSSLSIRRTLTEIGLPHSTFYAWYKRYLSQRVQVPSDFRSTARASNRGPAQSPAPHRDPREALPVAGRQRYESGQ